MKYLLLIFLLVAFMGCSPKLSSSFKKLSKSEKNWVFWHAFKAKKAYGITLNVQQTVDSVCNTGIIGCDINGGRLDAFKHSFWMARLAQAVGKRTANSLGQAHEKGNYQSYEKMQQEDGLLPDKQSTEMDLHNNAVGISIGHNFKNTSKKNIVNKVLDSLKHGKLRMLDKDSEGYFLDCQKQRIPLDSLKNRWDTMKCLVPSSTLMMN